MKKTKLLIIFIIIIILSVGCANDEIVGEENVSILVSKDFGNKNIKDKKIKISEDTNVMELMEENFEVETAYGGGFINAIGGLKSGFTDKKSKNKLDWFYYVNGILADIGARDYYVQSDDMIIWDYHDWSGNVYVSSIIGAYPMNFVNGNDGEILKTEIAYQENYKKDGEKLFDFLKVKGVKNIEMTKMGELKLEDGQTNSIIIGNWDEIYKLEEIKNYYENREKLGMFFEIDEKIKLFNHKRELTKEYDKGAVITSISKQYGMTGSLWMVTGNDEESIKKAVNILNTIPEKIRGKFSVFITEDEIISLPINK